VQQRARKVWQSSCKAAKSRPSGNGGSMANLRIESHAFDEVAGRFVPWAALLSGSGDGITGQLPKGSPKRNNRMKL